MLKVVVISLAHARQRRMAIAAQLDACGQDYHFLDAVDGSNDHAGILTGIDRERFLLETGRVVTEGEIGCYASHVAAWRICSDSGQPLVILEDDAVLTGDFCDAVYRCARLIERCGYIRLQTESRGRSRVVFEADKRFGLRLYSKVPHGAAGYVIGPRVAREMASKAAVMRMPIDVFVKKFWMHRQLIFGLGPYSVCNAPTVKSMIGPRPKADRTLRQKLDRQVLKVRHEFRRLLEAQRQSAALRHPNVHPGGTQGPGKLQRGSIDVDPGPHRPRRSQDRDMLEPAAGETDRRESV